MSSNKKTVPFYGTEEQKEQLLKVIQKLRDEKGCLMPIMQKAQEIYGYLPIEVQKIISDELNVPLEKIYGVATFYSWFNLNPKGKMRFPSVLVLHVMLRVPEIFTISSWRSLILQAVSVHRMVSFTGCLSLRRRLWSCTGYDGEW